MAPQEIAAFISVDVETAGPNPGSYALLAIGACLVSDPACGFYVELQPDRPGETSQAAAVHGLDLAHLATAGQPPGDALKRFAGWLSEVTPVGQQPVFLAFNAAFDWMFVNDYFHRYLGRNPFGHSALDIKAYAMGRLRLEWTATSMRDLSERYLEARQLSHNALQDARDQAELFLRLQDI